MTFYPSSRRLRYRWSNGHHTDPGQVCESSSIRAYNLTTVRPSSGSNDQIVRPPGPSLPAHRNKQACVGMRNLEVVVQHLDSHQHVF